MRWLDDVYMWTFMGTLGLGVLLFGFAGLVRLTSGLADVMEEHRIRRLRPRVATFGDTAAKVGSDDYRHAQSEIRDLIRDHGRWDAELGLYVVQMPESDRPVRGDGPVRYYAWARPPYVRRALLHSPVTGVAAALLLFFALGSMMWGGVHYGFPTGGLEQAVKDKYAVRWISELPAEPAPNQRVGGVSVLQDGESARTEGCVVDAGGGIDTLSVPCPDQDGRYRELPEAFLRPSEWFAW